MGGLPAAEERSRRDFGVAGGIVCILVVLFLPVPAILIALGFAVSVALAVLIVSLAAGLPVAKGGTRGTAEEAVLGQLGAYPRGSSLPERCRRLVLLRENARDQAVAAGRASDALGRHQDFHLSILLHDLPADVSGGQIPRRFGHRPEDQPLGILQLDERGCLARDLCAGLRLEPCNHLRERHAVASAELSRFRRAGQHASEDDRAGPASKQGHCRSHENDRLTLCFRTIVCNQVAGLTS
ncbi:hypothetical protein U8607_08165 [Methylobacterium durans]|uniref:hypothetical protein n=1 Tax=Methylobacterium durans TaxID=2202825 RepID=UPI002AFE95CF|nr:hypothetical protein [Methylobacterium durans]MEA1832056.1 hypothetical protein [Methylobacterium durans]